MELTQQERQPHGKLVECRVSIEKVLKLSRKHAAVVCNRLTHKQVEAVLAAGDDAEKMQKAVEYIEPEPKQDEQKQTEPKITKSNSNKK